MDFVSLQSIIQAFIDVFPQKASIAIADQNRFIYYQPSSSIDLKIQPGDEVVEGTLSKLAMERKMSVSKFLDKSPFGIPYYATSTPIFIGNKVEGCVTAIYPPYSGPQSPHMPRHQFLIGKTDDRWIPIAFKDVYLIESEDRKTFIHTANTIYSNQFSLVELEYMLPSDQFVRCHRAYVVNVNAIGEIQPNFHSTFTLIMKNERRTKVPVSQKYASRFRQLMGF